MKTKKLNNKLGLSKSTVSNLNSLSMGDIKGGISGGGTGEFCDTEVTCGATICDYTACNTSGTTPLTNETDCQTDCTRIWTVCF